MESLRIFRLFLLAVLVFCLPLAAQTVDTQSVTITYTGSSGANTSTVHVSNASNVTARISTNLDATGAPVSSAGNTSGVFVQNVGEPVSGVTPVNIGTDPNVLGALSRRGAATYTGATLRISATGCNDCIGVALTLQITNGGGVTVSFNGAPITNSGITLNAAAGGTAAGTVTLTSTQPTAFQITTSPSWLQASPAAGQLTGSTTVQLTANSAGLSNGANIATLSISAGGITTNITVTLNVGTGSGLSISPNPLNFQFITSTGAYSPSQTQYVQVFGASANASLTATASTTPNPQWLLVNGGTSASFSVGTTQIPISINPAILSLTTATTYTGTVTIQSSDGTPPVTLNVSLQITATPTTGGSNILTFNVAAPGGAAPAAQQITVTGTGSYNTVVGTNNCGQGWLQATPSSGALSSTGTTLTVQVFPGNIGSGTCTGTISISGLLTSSISVYTVNMVIGGTGVVGAGPAVSPAALTFTLPAGRGQSQTVLVNGDGSSFTAQAIGTNVTVTPTAGSTPATLTVTADSTSSSGTVVVTSQGVQTNVNITVNVLGGNVLIADPPDLTFIYTPGLNIQTRNVAISASQDATGAPLTFQVASAPSFVSYAVTSGSTPSSIGVGISTSQLAPGFNTGNIVLTSTSAAANSNLTIPVTVLAPGTSGLNASPGTVTLSGQQFGGPVSAQVSLTGLSGSTFNVSSVSSGNWLSACVGVQAAGCPTQGTTPATLTITANPGTLSAQATPYSGTVTVTAINGSSLTIPVNLTVSSTAPSTPVLNVSPLSLTFNYQTGGNAPAAQSIQVSTTGGAANYTATSNVNWINVSASTTTTPGTVSVSVNTALLTQPTQSGTVTIAASGATGSPQTVNVTANVTTPPALQLAITTTTFTYRTGDPTPPTQTVQIGSNGASLPFTVSVTNAPWLSVTPTSGNTTANLTLAVDPTKVQVGTYSATVTINSTGAASQSFMVQFNVSAPLPTIFEVRNGATNQAGPISPGLVIVLPGSFIGPDQQANFVLNGDVLATTVANTRVRVGGYLAPIIFSSSTLVAAIVPYEIAGKTSTFVDVVYLGQSSNAITVQVANTAPGIFTPDSPALPGPAPVAGAVLNADGSVNSAANATTVGQVVTVLVTGEGQLLPAGINGKLNDDPTAVPQPVVAPTATINGAPATVTAYSEVAGLPPGVMQVSVAVPDGATTGDLVVHIGGNDSQGGVTVFIQ